MIVDSVPRIEERALGVLHQHNYDVARVSGLGRVGWASHRHRGMSGTQGHAAPDYLHGPIRDSEK